MPLTLGNIVIDLGFHQAKRCLPEQVAEVCLKSVVVLLLVILLLEYSFLMGVISVDVAELVPST